MTDGKIVLGHGSGGELSHQLLEELIIPQLSGSDLSQRNDAAVLDFSAERLAFSTDSYVVDPLCFPGGNIGDLAINGTVNDLAMRGAQPLAISVGLIIEEGLALETLRLILGSMRRAADAAGVAIVTGDTKVVPYGKADGLFINTAGIGQLSHPLTLSGSEAAVGDRILINGTIGDHGLAVLSCREELAVSSPLRSDSQPLNALVAQLIERFGSAIHVLRDPTRGGVATTLNEIALQSQVAIRLREQALPIRPAVTALSGLLGLDPLFVANEGKMLISVAPEAASAALALMRCHPAGREAAEIGEVVAGHGVCLETALGGERVLNMLSGEQLPRIC